MGQTRGLFCSATHVWLTVMTPPVSLLAHEFDVRSMLHRQVSLAAANQICVIHEAMNDCENLMIHQRLL